MRIRVKVCCIANLDEARKAIECGANALGLVGQMPSGPGIITDEVAREIASQTPPPISTFLLTSETSAEKIAEHVELIDQQIKTISTGAEEQLTGVQEVNAAVNSMDQMTQQNAAMVEESTAASHTLRQDAGQLGQLIQRFVTSEAATSNIPAPRPVTPKPGTVGDQQERVKAFATQGSAALKTAPQDQPNDDDWFEF